MNFLRPLRFRQQLGEIDRRLQRVSRPHLDLGAFDELLCAALGVFREAPRLVGKGRGERDSDNPTVCADRMRSAFGDDRTPRSTDVQRSCR